MGTFSHLITPGTQREVLYHYHFTGVKTEAHKALPTVRKLVGGMAATMTRAFASPGPCSLCCTRQSWPPPPEVGATYWLWPEFWGHMFGFAVSPH